MDSFLDLPFRLVIQGILTYHNCHISDLREFDLFGYFSCDRFRKIFFIFCSIFLPGHKNKIPVIDFRELHSIKSDFPTEETLNVIISRSPIMRNLRALQFCSPSNEALYSLFSKKKCFPNLKRLEVSGSIKGSIDLDLSRMMIGEHIWKNIEFFRLFLYDRFKNNHTILPLFLNSEKGFLKNVKEMALHNTRLCESGSGSKLKMDLPKLESLQFLDSKTMSFFPVESFSSRTLNQLKRFDFRFRKKSDLEYLKRIFSDSPNLQSITFGVDLGITGTKNFMLTSELDFLFLEKPVPLKEIVLDGGSGIVGWTTWNESRNFSFLQNIERIEIYHPLPKIESLQNSGIEENFLENEFPKLKSLRLHQLSFPVSQKVQFTENITSIDFAVEDFSDLFFQNNHLKNLRKMEIHNCEFNGAKWNPLPELRNLQLGKLCEPLLENLRAPKLETLVAMFQDSFQVNKWNEEFTENLKVLEIGSTFLQPIRFEIPVRPCFSSLESFTASGVEIVFLSKSPKNWSGFSNLQSFHLSRSKNGDDLFAGKKWVKNLRVLELSHCGRMSGKGWEFMDKLLTLKIERCDKFFKNRVSFTKNPPFDTKKARVVFNKR